jgi:hypothetical protein
MTSLEGRAHGAFKRVSRLRSVPDGHRKRPAFAVLNGPLMARRSLVTNPWTHPAQYDDDEAGASINEVPRPR